MEHKEKYSICFQPDGIVLEEVSRMKTVLSEAIGAFNSKNSLAHITIAEFELDQRKISRIQKYLDQGCASFNPVPITFDSFGTYPNGAFFLDVDAKAKEILKTYGDLLMRLLHLKGAYRSNDPHMSIARKLNPAKILTAYHVLNTPNLTFTCDHIALRQFNRSKMQYDVIGTYSFQSRPIVESQLSLF